MLSTDDMLSADKMMLSDNVLSDVIIFFFLKTSHTPLILDDFPLLCSFSVTPKNVLPKDNKWFF
jgi:hypothetical protein